MEERGERGLGGEVGRVRSAWRSEKDTGLGREANSALRGKKAAASASKREKATLAMPCGVQLRIRAELGPRPTGMRNGLDFVCRPIYNRNEKNGVLISIRGLWCKKPPTLHRDGLCSLVP